MSDSTDLEHRLEAVRQEMVSAADAAAKADKVRIDTEGLVLLSDPRFAVVMAPMAGLDELDFSGIFEDRPVLQDTPVMYWYIGLNDTAKSALPAGFYSAQANDEQGTLRLVTADGRKVAEGGLTVGVGPGTTVVFKAPKVSAGIDDVDVGWTHVKVCGHVTVSQGGKSVTISGCIEASL